MKLLLLLFNILIILNLQSIVVTSLDVSAKCEQINPSSKCYNYLSYTNIYLPTGLTQDIIEANATATLTQFGIITDLVCKENAVKLFCITSYRQCNEGTVNGNIIPFPLPSNPCRKNCDIVSITCAVYLPFMPGFTCIQNDTDNQNGYPDIENHYNLTTYGGNGDQVIQCSNPNSQSTGNGTIECIYPLVYVETEKLNTGNKYFEIIPNCVLPCPLKVYTDKQYNTKFYTETVFYCISAAISIYLILTFGLFSNKLTHRGLIIVYLSITILSLCASYATQQYSNYGDWRCTEDIGRYRSSKGEGDGNCMLTGFFFQIGGLGSIFFLSLYSFDFFLAINMKTNNYFLQTSLAVWGFIIFFALLPIKHYESSIESAGCWIEDPNRFWIYFCFYIPVMIVTLLMVIFIVSSIYKVFKMNVLFHSNDKRLLFLNLRSVVFLVVVLFCITFASMYPLYVSYNWEVYTDQIEIFIMCILEKGYAQCPSVQFPLFNLRYMNAFCMAVIGILALFGLGIDPHVISIYKESERFKKLLNLFGIQWGTPSATPIKQSSNSTSSSGSNGNSKTGSSGKDKSSRKSRSQSISLKKIDQITSSTSNEDNENENIIISSDSSTNNNQDNNNV